ncbi:FadR/GntR family transcriptional regulator [Falsirhodobacter sp. alg1]|uniref:FadR/GntR family transcriptional regulator n=1 Tax=Falsirhodobacter sp. alg1 TaxID=1472418 RepID=UPI0005EDA033|nr:FadR/GntR family transcriptional regulator [Falsirhodobacter sp. alg1]
MTQSSPPSEPNSTYALEQLRAFLTTSGLGQGSRLPTERQLAEKFQVGRRALRRALDALEAEGVLWRRQGAGTFVGMREDDATPDVLMQVTDFNEIMEVRLRIEPQLAQLAALRARPEEITRMRALTKRLAESEDADSRELWDGTLHRLIAQSARNRLFLSLFDIVNRIRQDEAWRAMREQARRIAKSRAQTAMQHHDIVEAIAARDPVAAGEAMREHLLLMHETLIRQTSMIGTLHTPSPDQPEPQPLQQGTAI